MKKAYSLLVIIFCLVAEHLSAQQNTQYAVYRQFEYQNYRPFIIRNYNNRFYDQILKKLKFLPIPVIHGIAFCMNKSYDFKKVELKKLTL